MYLRRMAIGLVAVMAVAGACGGDEEDGASVSVHEPIGAPETQLADGSGPPSVVKSALIEMEVAGDELGAAAQRVVDLTTSPRIGGFLVSSVVDSEGYGTGRVLVEVPAGSFEIAVGELDRIGDVTRQELEGADVSPEAQAARGKVASARERIRTLSGRIEESDDSPARAALADAKEELLEAQREVAAVEGGAAYSSIDVALEGAPPPPAPKRSTFEQALDTAATVSLAIASGIVLAAAVVVPVALLVLMLLLVVPRIVRLVKPHLRA